MRLVPFLTACVFCAVSASATTAYNYPVEAGNQAFEGPLGMDFDVNSAIAITSLGVFDSNADGLSLQLTAYIYDRDLQTAVASLVFPVGNTGTLIGGAQFLALSTPLMLSAGFHGSVVVEGYGATELNGNLGPGGFTASSLDDGGGLISFVGVSRFGLTPGLYPDNLDTGPANRYGAGTFIFEDAAIAPEPGTMLLLGLGLVGGLIKLKFAHR